MRPSVALLCSLFAVSGLHLFAQQTATVQMEGPISEAGCPVDFSVQQSSAGQVSRVGDHRAAGAAQHLEITFRPDEHRRIDTAEITVEGTDGSVHAMLVGTGSSDVSKTFQLHREADTLSFRQFAVWVDGISSVRWVKLVSLRYADGTAWHSAEATPCRREPNRLLLIAAQAGRGN